MLASFLMPIFYENQSLKVCTVPFLNDIEKQSNSNQINFQVESVLKTGKDEKTEMLKDDDQINALVQEYTSRIVLPSQTL